MEHDVSKFKVGDKVRVTQVVHKATGWNNKWIDTMNDTVNCTGKIHSTNASIGFTLVFDSPLPEYMGGFGFPSCALELVSEKTIDSDIKSGCSTNTFYHDLFIDTCSGKLSFYDFKEMLK